MVIDMSVLIAIALGVPTRGRLLDALASEPGRVLSAMSLLEARLILRQLRGSRASGRA